MSKFAPGGNFSVRLQVVTSPRWICRDVGFVRCSLAEVARWREPCTDTPDAAWMLLRAYSFGHALPVGWNRGDVPIPACEVLPTEVVAKLAGLSDSLAERVTMLAEYIHDQSIFGALRAARRRESVCRDKALRCIIVDEVQDLTALELDFLCAYATSQPSPMFLLLAGDESQTTYGSGFTWGMLKDLVASRMGTNVRESALAHPLRSAARLNRLVASSGGLYRTLPKVERPHAAQSRQTHSTSEDGCILIAPSGPLQELVHALSAQPGRALVVLDQQPELPASGVVFAHRKSRGWSVGSWCSRVWARRYLPFTQTSWWGHWRTWFDGTRLMRFVWESVAPPIRSFCWSSPSRFPKPSTSKTRATSRGSSC